MLGDVAREGRGVSSSWSYHKPEDKVALVNMVLLNAEKVFGKKVLHQRFLRKGGCWGIRRKVFS